MCERDPQIQIRTIVNEEEREHKEGIAMEVINSSTSYIRYIL